MTNNRIGTTGVVGLGVMGFDIAFLYASIGHKTLAYDAAPEAMAPLERRREQTVERLRRRNRISDDAAENVRRQLVPCKELGDLREAELITEAVSENGATKTAVYRALKGVGFGGTLTSNTSSLTRAALLAEQPYGSRKFALTHFFNPVLHTRMIEVVTGDLEPERAQALLAFLETLGRDPVTTRDVSGFVSNGILMPYAVMALRLLERGARIEQVDAAAKESGLLPPLISFDAWKPSIVEDVTRVMFELRGDSFLRSSKLLGALAPGNPPFYKQGTPNATIAELAASGAADLPGPVVRNALRATVLAAAARVVELGEEPSVVDLVAVQGIKVPEPPLKEIDRRGAAQLLRELEAVNSVLGSGRLEPPRLLTAMAQEKETFYVGDRANPWLGSRQGF
jgi:3-hydroxyacyl-CoA dehydrogenase